MCDGLVLHVTDRSN